MEIPQHVVDTTGSRYVCKLTMAGQHMQSPLNYTPKPPFSVDFYQQDAMPFFKVDIYSGVWCGRERIGLVIHRLPYY